MTIGKNVVDGDTTILQSPSHKKRAMTLKRLLLGTH